MSRHPHARTRARSNLRLMRSTALLLAAAGLPGPALGQFYSWGLNTGGAWDTTTSNWLLNGTGALTTYPVAGSHAVFGGVFTSGRSVTVPSAITAFGITFRGVGGSAAYTIGSASPINLNNGASNEFINLDDVTPGVTQATQTISSNLTFVNNLGITNNGIFGVTNLTLSGTINRTVAGGAITVGGQGNTTISGAIGNTVTGGLTKTGAGVLHLSSASNAFTGDVNVNAGVLSVGANDVAFGNAANAVNVAGGGGVRFSTASYARRFNVNGTSTTPSIFDMPSGVTTTLTGTGATAGLVGSGALDLTLTGGTSAGMLSIEGDQTGFTGTINVGAPGVRLVGSNVTSRLFQAANGTTLRLRTTGKLSNATGITVNHAGALTITQPSSAVTGRLGAAAITLNGARFQYNPSTTAAIADSFGAVEITGSNWIIGGSAGNAGGTTLSFGNLTRTDNGMIAIQATNTVGAGYIGGGANAGVNYKFANLSDVGGTGTARNVIPWAAAATSAGSTDFSNLVTYDANGLRQLTASEVQVVTTTLSAGVNNNLQGTANNPGIISINALTNSTGTPQITGTGNVTVTSGAFVNYNTGTVSGPTLTFPNGGYFHLGFPMNIATTTAVTGANGIGVQAMGASSGYQLRFLNTVPNTFTGGLTINGNVGVTFRANNQLGNDGSGNATGQITLGGGQLIFEPASAVTVSLNDGSNNRPIKAGPAGGVIGTSVAGAILQIPGTISGSGQIQYGGGASSSGTGVVELTNTSANTYTGGSVIAAGILRLSNANQLGTGDVYLNGGTLQASGNLTFSVAPVVVASSTFDSQANSITLNAGIGGSGGLLGTAALTNTVNKNGTGHLIIAGNGTYAGSFSINAGTLQVSSGVTLPAGTIAVAAGSTLRVDGAVTQSDRTVVVATGSPGGRITGSGTIDRGVTVAAGGRVEPGNSVGNLTVASISLNGAALNFETGPGNTIDKLIVAGTATFITGNSTLNLTGPFIAAGSYDFITYATKAGALPTGVVLGTTPGGPFTYAVNFDADSYFLTVTQTGNDFNWDVDSGTAGAQDGSSPPNWTDGVSVWDNILATNATWSNAATNVMNFGGLGGAGPFTVTVDGTKTAASLSFTKNYTLNPLASETLRLQNGITASANATVNLPVTMLASNTFSVGTGATLNVSAGVGQNTSGLSITKSGDGTLVLGGPASFSGVANINGGTISISAVNQLNHADINMNGGTLLATANLSSGGALVLTGTANGIAAASGVTMTRTTATAAAAGGLTKVGDGTVVFTTSMNHTGGTTVSAGTLGFTLAGSLPATGPLTLNAGGSVNFANGAANSVSGALTTTAGSGINIGTGANLTLNPAADRTINSTISGAGSLSFNPTATAFLTLSGNNTFAGGVTGNANAGFVLNHANGYGAGSVTFANTTSVFTHTNNIAGGGVVANDFTLSGSATLTGFDQVLDNVTVEYTGRISGGNASGTAQFSNFSTTSAAVHKLSNATNNFLGTVEVDEGILAVANDGALGNSANKISLFAATTGSEGLRFDGGFSTARPINFRNTNALDTNGNTVTLTGGVTQTSTSAVLRKVGAGTLRVNFNTPSSGAFVSGNNVNVIAGRLNINGNLPFGPATTTVGANATLGGTGTMSGATTLAATGTIAPGESIGSLTLGALSISGTADANPANNAILHIEVNQDNATADKLVITNSTALGISATTLQFVFIGANAGPFAQSFVIVQDKGNNNPGATPSFEVVAPASVGGGIVEYALSYVNSDSGTFANDIQVSFVSVPEPGALALLAGALLGLRRRRD